jgi:hypothetical protein
VAQMWIWYFTTITISFLILRYAVKTQLEYKDMVKIKRDRYSTLSYYSDYYDDHLRENEIFRDITMRFFTLISIVCIVIPFVNIIYSLGIFLSANTTKIKATNNNGRTFIQKVFFIREKKEK